MATGIAFKEGGPLLPKNTKTSTLPLFYSVERTVATERATKGRTNPNFPAWQPALLVFRRAVRSCQRTLQHRQFTITHVGERWVDSGGESWAELSALNMKWIESAQGKILVDGCSKTKRYKFTLRSSFLHFVHHANRACTETQARSRSTYLLAKTPPLQVMCILYKYAEIMPKHKISPSTRFFPHKERYEIFDVKIFARKSCRKI